MKDPGRGQPAASDDIFRMFVESSVDGLLVIDSMGVVRFANEAAGAMFRDKTRELVGTHLGVPAVQRRTELALPGHGDLRFVEMAAAEISWEGEPATLASLRDFTDRKRSELEITEAAERFRGLVEQTIAGIFIVQDGRFVYANPRCAEIIDQGSVDELVAADPSTWIAEADRDRFSATIRRLLDREVTRAALEFRVLRRDGVSIEVGANGASATYRGRPAVIGLLQDISEKKRADEQIRLHLAQLKAVVAGSVELVMTMGEMRDPYTAGHERRVAEIAVAIGSELGLDAERLEGLRVAGMLHDVGKISIPAEILSKPGRLTEVEIALIREHPQAGFNVLRHVKFPWPVAEVAMQHHERIDGSGYPRGLKADAIVLEARILAVADVVEAMSSHRPYRSGLGLEKTLAEIERGRGTAYDAPAADACLRLFREKGYTIPP